MSTSIFIEKTEDTRGHMRHFGVKGDPLAVIDNQLNIYANS